MSDGNHRKQQPSSYHQGCVKFFHTIFTDIRYILTLIIFFLLICSIFLVLFCDTGSIFLCVCSYIHTSLDLETYYLFQFFQQLPLITLYVYIITLFHELGNLFNICRFPALQNGKLYTHMVSLTSPCSYLQSFAYCSLILVLLVVFFVTLINVLKPVY